jgi:DNA-binding transcriptional LysR family regulator
LAAAGQVSLAELARVPLGCYERGSASRRQVDAAFERAGLASSVVFELASSGEIIRYADRGVCVGIVSDQAFEPCHWPALARLAIGQLFPPLTTSIVMHPRTPLSRPARDFVDLLRLGAESSPAEVGPECAVTGAH